MTSVEPGDRTISAEDGGTDACRLIDKTSHEIIAEHCPLWTLTDPGGSLFSQTVPDLFTTADVRKEAWELINALADALDAAMEDNDG